MIFRLFSQMPNERYDHCGLALGSNLGDRLENLSAALEAILSVPGIQRESCRKATVYESGPVDCPEGSPLFLNTVVEMPYTGNLTDLLEETQRIEKTLGRVRGIPNAPRTVDIDLLYADDIVLKSERLTLPHPRMNERLFVIAPLQDVRPDLAKDTYLRLKAQDQETVTVFAQSW